MPGDRLTSPEAANSVRITRGVLVVCPDALASVSALRRHQVMAASLDNRNQLSMCIRIGGPVTVSFIDLSLSYHRDIVLTRGSGIFILRDRYHRFALSYANPVPHPLIPATARAS